MGQMDNNNQRCVYLAKFPDKHAYVGTTDDYERRIADHLFDDQKSEVYQHKRHTGLIPEFTLLHTYTTIEESDRLEFYYTIKFATEGWRMLNKQRPGGFGGIKETNNNKYSHSSKNRNIESQQVYRLDNKQYIKTPWAYAQIGGDMTHTELSLFVAVSIVLQDSIEQALEVMKKRKDVDVVDFLSYSDNTANTIEIHIPYSLLHSRAKGYSRIDEMLHNLEQKPFIYLQQDALGTWHTIIEPIFTKITIPKTYSSSGYERRSRYIEMEINADIAKHLFSLHNGYVMHIADIVQMCNNAKTPRLYLYLCTLNTQLHKKEGDIPYMQLMEILGVVTYEPKDHKKENPIWACKDSKVGDSYSTYSIFERDVLKKIKAEMDRLCTEGRVEFSFAYTAIRPNGKKIGTPEKFHFRLIDRSDLIPMADDVVDVEQPKPNYISGSSRGDYNLLKELAAKGNAWAIQALQDASQGKPFSTEDLRRELETV